MRVFEAKLQFNLVHLGEPEKIDEAEKVVAYLQSAIDTHPVHYVQRRIMLSWSTVTRRSNQTGYA
jgi:hypothetical protein